MTTTKTVVLSFAAGILGGALAVVAVSPLQAQRPSVPSELRSQSFILVTPDGAPAGRFGFDENGYPVIQLLGKNGSEMWRGGGDPLKPKFSPLGNK